MSPETAVSTVANFNLKHMDVELVPAARAAERAALSLRDLEALRVDQRAVPASKHALETICGASCETGAQ